MISPPRPFVIGTAGHVDHGKSTLVKALTGIDSGRMQCDGSLTISSAGLAHIPGTGHAAAAAAGAEPALLAMGSVALTV